MWEFLEEEVKVEEETQYLEEDCGFDVAQIDKILKFITANPLVGVQEIIEKYKLEWNIEKDFGNGIGLVGFYTDESLRYKAFELRLPIEELPWGAMGVKFT